MVRLPSESKDLQIGVLKEDRLKYVFARTRAHVSV